MRTIFLRPGARRPYVPFGALKDARADRDHYRDIIERASVALTFIEPEQDNSWAARGNRCWAILEAGRRPR